MKPWKLSIYLREALYERIIVMFDCCFCDLDSYPYISEKPCTSKFSGWFIAIYVTVTLSLHVSAYHRDVWLLFMWQTPCTSRLPWCFIAVYVIVIRKANTLVFFLLIDSSLCHPDRIKMLMNVLLCHYRFLSYLLWLFVLSGNWLSQISVSISGK